eukprot:TRINITY_DN1658_c0_g1_i1.p1 TRINITY_DN1658_c0_g1~~TRINITY_DN1658_c0_g1_i1.p1  ORF type:complete len:418 (+),score=98.06 TRINITY_DN1658_c0_g1_i1:33-1256(+)
MSYTKEEILLSQVNCTSGRFEMDRFGCFCFPNFEGERCETSIEWFNTIGLIASVVGLIGMAVVLYWLILRILFQISKEKFLMNLNSVSTVLVSLACLGRIIFCAMPNNGLKYTNDISQFTSYTSTVLTTLPITLWLFAHCMIVGFWLDILKAKLAKGLATRTRYVCIALAVISLLTLPGLILGLFNNLDVVGSILVVVPLLIIIGGLTIVTLVISCHNLANMSDSTKRKKARMVQRMWMSLSGWYLFLLTTLYFAYEVLLDKPIRSVTVIALLHRFSEIVAAVGLTRMIDQKVGIAKLSSWAFCGLKIADDGMGISSTGTGSTSRPGTKGLSSRDSTVPSSPSHSLVSSASPASMEIISDSGSELTSSSPSSSLSSSSVTASSSYLSSSTISGSRSASEAYISEAHS